MPLKRCRSGASFSARWVLLLRANCVRPLLRHQNEGARHLSHVLPAQQSVTLGVGRCPLLLGDEDGLRECEARVQEWRRRAVRAGFTFSVTRMKSPVEEAGKE
jgi:hypothetical protein